MFCFLVMIALAGLDSQNLNQMIQSTSSICAFLSLSAVVQNVLDAIQLFTKDLYMSPQAVMW